jgi:GntR family transcriptional repressor for pyruvate dehydrogenase complex
LRRPRNLAAALVDAFGLRIREGQLKVGERLPTEAAIMAEFGVSRTVVREALSKLQAGGLVETRHGIGTFVLSLGERGNFFSIAPEQMATLREVISVLELRIGMEAEAAGLAALRRSDDNLQVMRASLLAFTAAIEDNTDAVSADFELHMEIARATQNVHFVDLMTYLGAMLIPRNRINTAGFAGEDRRDYLKRVHVEHESIVNAIANQDSEAARAAMRTHLSNSRERLRRAQVDLA